MRHGNFWPTPPEPNFVVSEPSRMPAMVGWATLQQMMATPANTGRDGGGLEKVTIVDLICQKKKPNVR